MSWWSPPKITNDILTGTTQLHRELNTKSSCALGDLLAKAQWGYPYVQVHLCQDLHSKNKDTIFVIVKLAMPWQKWSILPKALNNLLIFTIKVWLFEFIAQWPLSALVWEKSAIGAVSIHSPPGPLSSCCQTTRFYSVWQCLYFKHKIRSEELIPPICTENVIPITVSVGDLNAFLNGAQLRMLKIRQMLGVQGSLLLTPSPQPKKNLKKYLQHLQWRRIELEHVNLPETAKTSAKAKEWLRIKSEDDTGSAQDWIHPVMQGKRRHSEALPLTTELLPMDELRKKRNHCVFSAGYTVVTPPGSNAQSQHNGHTDEPI